MIIETEFKSAADELQALVTSEKNEHAREAFKRAIEIVERHEKRRLEDSKVALKVRKSKGKKIGGGIPYGRRLIDPNATLDERGKLEDDPDEQRVIARARKLYLDGLSLEKVADQLKLDGIEPRKTTEENQGRFFASQISRMIDADTRRLRSGRKKDRQDQGTLTVIRHPPMLRTRRRSRRRS